MAKQKKQQKMMEKPVVSKIESDSNSDNDSDSDTDRKQRNRNENNEKRVQKKEIEQDENDDDVEMKSDDSSSSSSTSSNSASSSSNSSDQKEEDEEDDENDRKKKEKSKKKRKDDDDEEDMEEEGNEVDQRTEQKDTSSKSAATIAAPTLSKSWAIRTSHSPMYTGGKITHSHCHYNFDESSNDKQQPQLKQRHRPFLLLPDDGNVILVDTLTGRPVASVREDKRKIGTTGGDNNDYEDDDNVDADAITAYALSWNDEIIVTCSQNMILRQYAIERHQNQQVVSQETEKDKEKAAASNDDDDDDDENNVNNVDNVHIRLLNTWGRSGHTLPVTQFTFHASNTFVATGSIDGTVRVWDARHGHCTHVYFPLQSTDSSSGACAEDMFAGGSGKRSVTAVKWYTEDPHLLLIAIGRDDGSITIHNLREKAQDKPVAFLKEDHVSAVTCLEWTLGGRFFVSAGRDAVLNLWSVTKVAAAQEVAPVKEYSKKKKSKAMVATTTAEVAVLPSFRYIRVHTLPIYEQIEGMVLLSTDSKRSKAKKEQGSVVVATAGSKGRVRTWKLVTNSESGGGKNVGETIHRGHLEFLNEQPVAETFGEERGGYLDLSLNPFCVDAEDNYASRKELVVADAEHNLAFLSLHPETILATKRTIVGHNDDILDLKVIPATDEVRKESRIVVATNSAKVRIFDLNDFSCHVLDGHKAIVLCVDVSPCGRFIATCGKDNQLRLWHVESKKCVALASGHTEAVGAAAMSRKMGRYSVVGKAAKNGGGAFCVSASSDRTMKRWNFPGAPAIDEACNKNEQILLSAFKSVRAHEKDINIISVAPNDSLIASGSQDKTVKLWNATDLTLKATLKGHKRGVWDCQFSPFDRVLATGSGDKTIKIWSLSDYSCVRSFQGHIASVLRVRFLSGGLQLASSGSDGLLKIWTIRTNECEVTIEGHDDKIWALDLTADGKTMVSGGADSQILVWKDTTKEAEESKAAEEREAILFDQQLANYMRHKEYSKALEIALARDKPHHVLKILAAIIEADLGTKQKSLENHAKSWSDEKIVKVLRYCREWNTRALNSHVAMTTCQAIFTSFPIQKLAEIDGVPEILAGIIPYAERHFDRIDRLHGSSYLLDFVLFSMGSLGMDEASEADFRAWEANSRLVLPPKILDGKIQVGGKVVVRQGASNHHAEDSDSDEVMTVGDSDSSDED